MPIFSSTEYVWVWSNFAIKKIFSPDKRTLGSRLGTDSMCLREPGASNHMVRSLFSGFGVHLRNAINRSRPFLCCNERWTLSEVITSSCTRKSSFYRVIPAQ